MTNPNRATIAEAASRIDGFARVTPVLEVSGEEFGLTPETEVYLKLEHLQPSGSFKARGAANALQLVRDRQAGVIAASGGNHGLAVAWAAQQLGLPARIFVPTISAAAKVDRLRRMGATVHVVGDVFAESLEAAVAESASTGAELIHAYDDSRVMAGAGTLAAEFDHQVRAGAASETRLDEVVVACGGGGLAGGLCAWWGSSGPDLTIVESEGTNCLAAAMSAGKPVPVHPSGLCADALGASQIGQLAWTAISSARAESLVVTDGEVRDSQNFLWERFRLLVEPAAATTVAALRRRGAQPDALLSRIGVVLCGANVATPTL